MNAIEETEARAYREYLEALEKWKAAVAARAEAYAERVGQRGANE